MAGPAGAGSGRSRTRPPGEAEAPAPTDSRAGSWRHGPLPAPPPAPRPDPPASALTTVAALEAEGLTAPADRAALERVAQGFRIRLSPEMHRALAGTGSPALAAQFLPDPRELVLRPEELADPIGDAAHSPVPGLTRRYPDRAILHLTRNCEVYCRFCFRREVVGGEGTLSEPALARALDWLAATPAVRELILTGGDPLILSPRRLGALLDRLEAIPHLDLLRIHSRVPVVGPARIDAAMLSALSGRRFPVWLAVHTNHADELTAEARAALARLSAAGIALVSQTVLLRGVNDSVAALSALFSALIRLRVKPYYLHHCDLAKGISHFRTTIAEGQALMAALRGRISGLALPSYVLDLPGGHGKVPLDPGWAEQIAPGRWRIRDWQGGFHLYDDPPRPQAAGPAGAGSSARSSAAQPRSGAGPTARASSRHGASSQ